MTDVCQFLQGTLPLLVSVPHAGTMLPPDIRERLTENAAGLPDTDWYVDQLYSFAATMGASVITANYSRYVIDLNRPPDDTSLYPGQAGTGLCPTTLFDGQPLYKNGRFPDHAEIELRLSRYWQPYHSRIKAELERLVKAHGKVLLWDGHSIRSRVPRLFAGRLPDLNFGTAGGKSCAPLIADRIAAVAQQQKKFTSVLNGRFQGGYITRHYGSPDKGIHAIQLELAQNTYMDEEVDPIFDEARAKYLIATLKDLLTEAVATLTG